MNTLQDRIRGSFIGGAAGDALGYPVEFLKDFKKIRDVYGENGITKLTPPWSVDGEKYDKALISDDTQMTLFIANGILNAIRQRIAMKYGICLAYIEWYLTQIGKKSGKYKDCWIASVPELNKRRPACHHFILFTRDMTPSMIVKVTEIAEGKGMILQRTWDRQFLMDVRNHKYEYDEIIEMLERDKERMNQLIELSTIREKIDVGFVNQLMIDIRKKQMTI